MSEKEKSAGQLLKEKLLRSPKNAGETLSDEEIKAAFDYCEPYKRGKRKMLPDPAHS